MGLPAVGSVILVPFPYADFSALKHRPALVVAHAEFGNLIVCQITSKAHTNRAAVELGPDDFKAGGLRVVSFVRPDKLFTLESSLVERQLGVLSGASVDNILRHLRNLFSE